MIRDLETATPIASVSHEFIGCVRKIRWHSMRHTAASMLLSLGTNPKLLQQTLGHADVKVTLSVYSHLMKDDSAEAARRMSGLLQHLGI